MGSPSHRFSSRILTVLALACSAATTLAANTISGPQSTMIVEGPMARSQLELFNITLIVTAFIFVAVGGVLAYAQIKFRARPGDEHKAPPPQTHGHPAVEIGLIVASVVLLVFIAVPTVSRIAYMHDIPKDSLVVRATGLQWWFKFEYPDLGVITGNELVIPTNKPIHIQLRTADVIHSFWVPKLAGKVDLIPNRANEMWLQAERENYYWAQCAEFCGESHANMRFRVISLDPAEFEAWVARQKAEARTVKPLTADADTPRIQLVSTGQTAPDAGVSRAESPFTYWRDRQVEPEPASEDAALIAQGRALFGQKTCLGCHSIRGHDYNGNTGPDLTHFGSRTTIAAALIDNTPENLHRWLREPNVIKPGNLMWRDGYVKNNITLTEGDIDALTAYLLSLK